MQQTMDVQITRFMAGTGAMANDILAVEEPLEIRIKWYNGDAIASKKIAVTMRTPGNDAELALGFLFTEGIVSSIFIVEQVSVSENNVVTVTLQKGAMPNLVNAERNFYTTSSCGVCGKASIEAVFSWNSKDDYPYDALKVEAGTIYKLPGLLGAVQGVFTTTGGIHACALYKKNGELALIREDVGRHNAMDKLVGALQQDTTIDTAASILLLSGRASFELLQKAAVAGLKMVVAIGAPSSLAVQMAEEWNITLIGFLRGEKFNIYSGAQRVVI